MRPVILLALAAVLLAQDEDGKHTDDYWGFELKLPGLERAFGLADREQVYIGHVDRPSELWIRVRVLETEKPRPIAQWLTDVKAKFKDRTEETSGSHWLVFRHKDRLGFVKVHGYAYVVRGAQCFEVHVESDGKPVLDALKGLKLKAAAPGTLSAYWLAVGKKMAPDDPRVLLAAGFEYLTRQKYRVRSPSLAAKVLALARAGMKKDTFKPLELWSLYEYAGLALADQPARAIEWHALAETAAAKLKERPAKHRRTSAFNLACAYAGAKKPDEAFAALYRSYEGGKPVPDANVSGDKRLVSLRRDERWHKFWSDCVKR